MSVASLAPPKAWKDSEATGATAELALVAQRLRNLADACEEYGRGSQERFEEVAPLNLQGELAALASRYLHYRRARDGLFPPSLFSDPAWDILLDLYVARVEERRISVTSACIAAAVPQSTALRCVGQLVKEHLIVRTADQSDHRRVWLTLTPAAETAISKWLSMLRDDWNRRRPQGNKDEVR